MAERLPQISNSDFGMIPQALMTHALDTFGNAEKAESWMMTPNPALDNQEPVHLAQTIQGAERVEEVLTRIDYGIYS